ncbi:MAG TPA: ParB/RepB/Spo0J family partition protein, partial [Polyangiaceae bacterium]|nr:ParB/RepB/Spo0J family partition protein [Polyangiaceae bacterium]
MESAQLSLGATHKNSRQRRFAARDRSQAGSRMAVLVRGAPSLRSMCFLPWRIALRLRLFSSHSARSSGRQGEGVARVLTRSVLASGSAPHAASARALASCRSVALLSVRRLRRAIFPTTTAKEIGMSATTTHTNTATNEARFLAPETHQRANGQDQDDTATDREGMRFIPLSKLVPSPLNVRKTGGTNIDELAMLIDAHGLLQGLICVEHMRKKKPTGKYEVVAGGR